MNAEVSHIAGTLYVLAAPSGAGKTTLAKALASSSASVKLSVSYTTRLKRPSEREGEDYFFVSQEQFVDMIAQGVFLEHAKVFGHQYGTSKAWVDAQLARGNDVILEIDWQGAHQIRERVPECVSIFVLPPSQATLKRRLIGRKEDDEKIIASRLNAASSEIAHYNEFDYIVVNDAFETALADIRAIMKVRTLRREAQKVHYKLLLAQLLKSE